MRVFCRFAPPTGPTASLDARNSDALLLLRAEGQPLDSSAASVASTSSRASFTGTRVHITDPVTLSKAAFSCDGVFLPPTQVNCSCFTDNTSLIKSQEYQQELLYATTCKDLLTGASSTTAPATGGNAPRRIYLAYGQTASGKTYSLFGSVPPRRAAAHAVPPAVGVVPRFLYDIFKSVSNTSNSIHKANTTNAGSHKHTSSSGDGEGVFVDISCFEVYNEVTTDLVALSTVLMDISVKATSAAAALRGNRNDSNLSAPRSVVNAHTLKLQQEQAPVWAAHHLYCDAQEDGERTLSVRNSGSTCCSLRMVPASSTTRISQEEYGRIQSSLRIGDRSDGTLPVLKTEYRPTEKQQVLRSVERARCTTYAEAQAVLHALLTLRQECATSRNQSSSRGHLTFRVETYRSARSRDERTWVLLHETAFVDLAGSESGRLTDTTAAAAAPATSAAADRTSSEPFSSSGTQLNTIPQRRRGRSSGPLLVNDTFAGGPSRASSQHSRHSSFESSVYSAGSSQLSNGSSNASINSSSSVTAAYHRYLLHPPQEEDARAARVLRQRETRCINASLLALRKVFRALYEATQVTSSCAASTMSTQNTTAAAVGLRRPPLHHAPFKDSALTTILQPFLIPQTPTPSSSLSAPKVEQKCPRQQQSEVWGGSMSSVHVVLLVCCSSRSADFFETVASLRLGAEATAVNPEVVLRALPVQRREQQQQLHLLNAQCESNGFDSCGCRTCLSNTGPQKLFRSASAPNQRLLLLHTQPAQVNPGRDGEDSSAGVSENATNCAQVRVGDHRRKDQGGLVASRSEAKTLADLARAQRDSSSRKSTSTSEEVAGLREEVQRYKSTAQQLYRQCKSLCESYDECVEELGAYRVLLAEKDARIAELEMRLAAAERANVPWILHFDPPPPITQLVNKSGKPTVDGSNAGAAVFTTAVFADSSTPARGESACVMEGSSSPAARSPVSSSPTQRAQQQQPCFYERCRVARNPSFTRKPGVDPTTYELMIGSDGTQPQDEVHQQHITKSERRARVTTRTSRSRGFSSSTAREESTRCMVSVSPFSTASLMAVNAEGNATLEECGDDAKPAEGDFKDGVFGREPHAAPDVPTLPSALPRGQASDTVSVSIRENSRDDVEDPKFAHSEQQQQQHQQMQKARSIMNTLLTRQIFLPRTATASLTSPVLPTPSAHANHGSSSSSNNNDYAHTGAVTAAATVTMSEDYTDVINEVIPSNVNSTASVSPSAMMLAAHQLSTSPPRSSCEAALPSASVHVGGNIAGATASLEEARRSTSGGGDGQSEWEVESDNYVRQVPLKRSQRERLTATTAVAVEARERMSDGSDSSYAEHQARSKDASHVQSAMDTFPRNARPLQSSVLSLDRNEAKLKWGKSLSSPPAEDNNVDNNDANEVEEIVISYGGSPAVPVAATSESSTRRSKSTVYTALMPPSLSCSANNSRSPSFHESLPNSCGVHQL